mgnify:CR=1 FL=1
MTAVPQGASCTVLSHFFCSLIASNDCCCPEQAAGVLRQFLAKVTRSSRPVVGKQDYRVLHQDFQHPAIRRVASCVRRVFLTGAHSVPRTVANHT